MANAMTDVTAFTPLEWLNIHVNILYRTDLDGRLRSINEVGEPPAPCFYMGRTLQGNVWRFRHDVPAAAVDELDRLCRAEPLATKLDVLPQNYEAIRAVIQRHLALPELREYRGPAYWIPARAQTHGDALLITEANAEVLGEPFAWLLDYLPNPANGPAAALVEDGRVVSLCFCSRRPVVGTEAGLETLEPFRGRGFALRVVATWAAEVRRLGYLPMYSTSWDNLASQAVARKLGMVCYAEDWSIR
jgi:hypothetical protein